MDMNNSVKLNSVDVLTNHNMSFSMLIDSNIHNDPLTSALPRKIHSWVNDSNSSECYNCNESFSLLKRKHHCRLCGRIFCYSCCNKYELIPDTLSLSRAKKNIWHHIESYFTLKNVSKRKICNKCNMLIKRINSIKIWIQIFCFAGLDIKEIMVVRQVCKKWWFAANYYMSIFREIQYKLPNEKYSKLEKNLIWINAKYLGGHSKYISSLLKISTDNDINKVINIIKQPKKTRCRMMMCTRNCTEKLLPTDLINILVHCYRRNKMCNHRSKGFSRYRSSTSSTSLTYTTDKIKSIVLQNINCSDVEFKCYIPLLIYNIRYDNGILAKFLIKKCLSSYDILSNVYWEINLYRNGTKTIPIYNQFFANLLKEISKNEDMYIKIMESDSFVKLIDKIGTSICKNNMMPSECKNKFCLKHDIIYPIDTTKRIKKIDINKIITKSSISRPIIIPCTTTTNKITRLMYKRDNLRNDQIIINIINLMTIIVKRDIGLDLNVLTYNVLPLSNKSGIIEIMDNAETIYYIKEKMKMSILNFIMENNENKTIKDIRDGIIKSIAAYCVITYLMGVGDRHLDNIMVSKKGKIFHIDYGYILGNDTIFNNASIRLTPEMVDAIGGLGSRHYNYFKVICAKIFNCMRRNINIFMDMLLILPSISNIRLTEKEIMEQVYKRFIPGENDMSATLYIEQKLEENHLSYQFKDFCHYHSQEKTFNGLIDSFKLKVYNIWNKIYPSNTQSKNDKEEEGEENK